MVTCRNVLLILVAVPLVLIVFFVGTGFLLPETWQGELDARSKAPPVEVWAALHDHEAHPIGGDAVVQVEAVSGGWAEDLGPSVVTWQAVEMQHPEHLVWQGSDSVIPMTLRIELTLLPEDGGTRVRGRQRLQIRNGTWHVPLFRWALLLAGSTAGTSAWLEDVTHP